ncbi:AMP nucleosidase [Thalassobaculum sp. OXR-137]|uniref:AMP nucleosidase n=1 Tax=Thalassobaculum sp. OXR-137 TaxID=3100173 RepID=UPI002AC9F0AF|nr:AMP nucleosidase [Thalassobaculum sp. OXR-137]WPZ33564.1 AMP nucleosidase [Thalassobaculum sp. OXR-137]
MSSSGDPAAARMRAFDSAEGVVEELDRLYRAETERLQAAFHSFEAGTMQGRVRATYPMVRLTVTDDDVGPLSTGAFGFADEAGVYEGTFTRIDLFKTHLTKQVGAILENHRRPLEVGLSDLPIPLPFAFPDGMKVGDGFDGAAMSRLKRHFDMPSLRVMDDCIVNGEVDHTPSGALPLALFTAPRVDYSLHRLRHYCGTSAEHFQNYVLFTNYQVYIDGFIQRAEELVQQKGSGYTAFVEPGDRVLRPDGTALGAPASRAPQMPAYHLVRDGHQGITMVNIGVGPSNAKTITDHVAVLRPNVWLMLGHCAGLRNMQRLGDYVLAHAYHRDDHVLDADLPVWVPIPALAEVQLALEQAVADITGLDAIGVKRIMRTGTVASTDNRNWELRDQREPDRALSLSRAIALDMESATVAANGFRMRVPYGTLLCVSDKPLHGELKLPGMADDFYRRQVAQHLDIGFRAMEILRGLPPEKLHSRKLRSFNEVPLQ